MYHAYPLPSFTAFQFSQLEKLYVGNHPMMFGITVFRYQYLAKFLNYLAKTLRFTQLWQLHLFEQFSSLRQFAGKFSPLISMATILSPLPILDALFVDGSWLSNVQTLVLHADSLTSSIYSTAKPI